MQQWWENLFGTRVQLKMISYWNFLTKQQSKVHPRSSKQSVWNFINEAEKADKHMNDRLPLSSSARYAKGTDFHRSCYNQWGLRWVSDCIFVMHEATIHNGIILEDYLVAVAALQALLIAVALMWPILHLLEVPDHTKLAHSCHQMALLLPAFCDLVKFKNKIFKHLYPCS